MALNFLCLNDDKTEVLLIGSKTSHSKLNIPHISIGDEEIRLSTHAKNIGFIFDQFLSGKEHESAICKSSWYHLRNIGRICKYLDNSATEKLVHAFVTSKLDINNSLLHGLPDNLLSRLQRVQNAAARLTVKLPKLSHITPVLKDLHWLPIKRRIQYKILLIVFKALNNLAPIYITDLLERRPESSRSSRLNNQNLLVVPRSHSVIYGDRNFCNIAPKLWNNLPGDLRQCNSLCSFKSLLKTHLFREEFL